MNISSQYKNKNIKWNKYKHATLPIQDVTRILILLILRFFMTAVQKGRMPTTQMEPQPPLISGLPDVGNQSFFSSYITLLLRADTIARYDTSHMRFKLKFAIHNASVHNLFC